MKHLAESNPSAQFAPGTSQTDHHLPKPMMKEGTVGQGKNTTSFEMPNVIPGFQKSGDFVVKNENASAIEVTESRSSSVDAHKPFKDETFCGLATTKTIPGLDLVVDKSNSYVVHKESARTRGSLENDLQSAYSQETMGTAVGGSGGQDPDSVIRSLGKIVSQLQALHNTNKNLQEQTSVSEVAGKIQKEDDYLKSVAEPKSLSGRNEDDATTKMAALIENETDSEGEDNKTQTDGYQPPSIDSREFSGFDTTSNMYHDDHSSSVYMYEKGNNVDGNGSSFTNNREMNQSFSASSYSYEDDSRTEQFYEQGQGKKYSSSQLAQHSFTNSDYPSRRPMVESDYHSHHSDYRTCNDAHLPSHDPLPSRNVLPPRNPLPPRDTLPPHDPYLSRGYHNRNVPHKPSLKDSPSSSYHNPEYLQPPPRDDYSQTYHNQSYQPITPSRGYRDQEYGDSYSREYREPYSYEQSSRIPDRNKETGYYEEDAFQYSHKQVQQDIPHSSYPPTQYHHEDSSSMMLTNIQSVDYDHGRVYDTGWLV